MNILVIINHFWPETLSATGVVRSERILGWVGKLVRFIYRGCDQILVQSKAFSSSVEQLAPTSTPIRYFPNTAEELYQPLQLEEGAPEYAMMPEGFRVMFAGNLGVAQDFRTILDAAELLKDNPEIQWVIIDDGRRRAWIEQEIVKRGLAGR